MGARLVVQSGVSAGSVHWIDRNVVRVGSSAKSDMCIPSTEVDEHALTVEFRQGGYFVYSRSQEPCYLSGQALQRNQPHEWHDTDLVELPGGVQLSLDCDPDPTPCPPPASQPSWMSGDPIDEEPNDSIHSSPGSKTQVLPESQARDSKSSNKALQWLVILFCVVGSVGLLALDQLESEIDQVEQLSFDSVVRAALQASEEVDSGLIASLQKAEVSMLRGNVEKARNQYARLHRLLEDTSTDNQQLNQVAQLVEQRLVQLGQL